MSEFVSPRKVDEQEREYRHQRFESFMVRVDRGEMSRELAIQALREIIWYLEEGNDG